MGVLREYITLVRPYGILFLGFMPVFGALCNNDFSASHLFVLLVIGLCMHVFGFAQNDYYDIEVDKRSKYVKQRPLATSVISQQQALVLFLCSFLVAVILAAVFFFSLYSMVVLLVSFLFMTLYNKFNKQIGGMECVLGAGVFLFGLFGGFTVSDVLSPLVVIVSFVGFFQWMFSVGVSANLKDVEYDTKLGIRTTPVLFGVHAVHNNLVKPVRFMMYVYGIKIVHLLVAFLPFVLGYTSMSIHGFPLPLLCYLLVGSVMLVTTRGLLSMPLGKRDTMLRYEGAHEGLALLLIPVVLMSSLIDHVGFLPTVLLFFLFIAWPLLSLRVLFGKTLIPLE